MSKIDKLKKLEDLGWDAFSKTGSINDYGIIVSAREMKKELIKEQDENQPGF